MTVERRRLKGIRMGRGGDGEGATIFLLQMETSTVRLTWFNALISTAKGYRNRLGIGDGNNNELKQ